MGYGLPAFISMRVSWVSYKANCTGVLRWVVSVIFLQIERLVLSEEGLNIGIVFGSRFGERRVLD